MNIYLISDTHFGHTKLQEGGIRPADNDEKCWKGLDSLPEDAILIHCGDLTLGADVSTSQRMSQYKFKKWLVRGNHDNHSISWYITNGWDFVADEIVIKMFGATILFTHAPLPKQEGINKNIHGHLHGGKSRGFPDFYDTNYHTEITPEAIGYTPAKLGSKNI